MRIGVLTSSRADFGIYLPLLKKLVEDKYFDINLITFGTHSSKLHGYTISEIIESGLHPKYILDCVLNGDSPKDIVKNIAEICKQFSIFWEINYKEFDLVFCLGDRYEMFAAVISGIPFGVKFAHFHGGETTLGSIDNFYRHSITLASCIHFTATDKYAEKVKEITSQKDNIYSTGALSLANLSNVKLLTIEEFYSKWNISLDKPTVLVTVHPETVAFNDVKKHAVILVQTILKISTTYQVIITMPNADTNGNIIRNEININLGGIKNILIIENLGKTSYFTAMKNCLFLLGNTSSGIIEAATFNKYVINLGERQRGRITSKNILHSGFVTKEILEKINIIKNNNYFFNGDNIYYKNGTINLIINSLKKI
jgi:GDP/UDP-N,N'-diacetylbacillosamine 2-epimerase (hydrolysing)